MKVRIAVEIIPGGHMKAASLLSGDLGRGTATHYDVLEIADGMLLSEIKTRVDRLYAMATKRDAQVFIDPTDYAKVLGGLNA